MEAGLQQLSVCLYVVSFVLALLGFLLLVGLSFFLSLFGRSFFLSFFRLALLGTQLFLCRLVWPGLGLCASVSSAECW